MTLTVLRRDGEKVRIGDDITVTVEQSGSRTKVSIDAPKDVRIMRDELLTLSTADAVVGILELIAESHTSDSITPGYTCITVPDDWIAKARARVADYNLERYGRKVEVVSG